jgi:ribosomal protein S18 acetylase RimI-like enzyme
LRRATASATVDEVNIRPARNGDAAGITHVQVMSWKAAYAGLMPDDYLRTLSAADRLPMWEKALTDPERNTHIFVTEENDEIVGFASAGPSLDSDADDGTAALYSIYLLAQYWGRGIGRRLHDQALGALISDGYRSVTLWVLDTNRRARAFYESAGWTPDGSAQVADVFGLQVSEIRYARVL